MLQLVRMVKRYVVVQLVKVLGYKPEGGGFDSQSFSSRDTEWLCSETQL